jgi:hypothetical protein
MEFALSKIKQWSLSNPDTIQRTIPASITTLREWLKLCASKGTANKMAMAFKVQAEVENNFKNVFKPEWVQKIGKSILESTYD